MKCEHKDDRAACRDLSCIIDGYKDENEKLKEEITMHTENISDYVDEITRLREALEWLDDYINQNYGGMAYMQEKIRAALGRVDEV